MLNEIRAKHRASKSCIIALHCSLNSGRQWKQLAELANGTHRFISPDLSGYGNNRTNFDMPTTLALEVGFLKEQLDAVAEPIHLIGHSYGGAVAFKIATAPELAARVRSLTLIEPVLPTLLKENAADQRLHDRFAALGHAVCVDIWNGAQIEAVEKFTAFWNGSGPSERVSGKALARMLEHIEKVAFDFCAILGEEGVTVAAETISIPTLLFSGGLSPYLTQRIVGRLASIIPCAQAEHLPAAGHMLALTHGEILNETIMRHVTSADECAELPLVADQTASSDAIKIQ
jgi:pimeloyl-ACP methyl ester carboxylesterase